MKIYPVTSARAGPIDRNPFQRTSVYEATGVAPHALTTRWTYTVPSGKKFTIGSAFTQMHTTVNQATAGNVQASIALTPSGGAVGGLIRAGMAYSATVVNPSTSVIGGGNFLAGDALLGRTEDLGIGGTITYLVALQGTEFDA